MATSAFDFIGMLFLVPRTPVSCVISNLHFESLILSNLQEKQVKSRNSWISFHELHQQCIKISISESCSCKYPLFFKGLNYSHDAKRHACYMGIKKLTGYFLFFVWRQNLMKYKSKKKWKSILYICQDENHSILDVGPVLRISVLGYELLPRAGLSSVQRVLWFNWRKTLVYFLHSVKLWHLRHTIQTSKICLRFH